MTELDRFEALAALYYADTGHMRPGKDDARCRELGSEYDPNSMLNEHRFSAWLTNWALTSALDRIVKLEREVAADENTIDELNARIGGLT